MALAVAGPVPALGTPGSAHIVRYRVVGPHLWHERLALLREAPGECLPGEAAAAWVLCPDGSSLDESIEVDTTDVAAVRALPSLGGNPGPPALAHVNRFANVPSALAVWTAIAEGIEATGWARPPDPFTITVSMPGVMPGIVNLAMPPAIGVRLGLAGPGVAGAAVGIPPGLNLAALAAALGLPAPAPAGGQCPRRTRLAVPESSQEAAEAEEQRPWER